METAPIEGQSINLTAGKQENLLMSLELFVSALGCFFDDNFHLLANEYIGPAHMMHAHILWLFMNVLVSRAVHRYPATL